MSTNKSYRRYNPQFKLQLCYGIRDSHIGRREAQRTYRVSANLIRMWSNQFDRGKLDSKKAAASTVTEYEVKIAALECKVRQLTMGVDPLKKMSRLLLVNSNENSSIVSGPLVAPSARDAT